MRAANPTQGHNSDVIACHNTSGLKSTGEPITWPARQTNRRPSSPIRAARAVSVIDDDHGHKTEPNGNPTTARPGFSSNTWLLPQRLLYGYTTIVQPRGSDRSPFYHAVVQKASNNAMIFVVERIQQMLYVVSGAGRLGVSRTYQVRGHRLPGDGLAFQVAHDERPVVLELFRR